MLSKEILMLLTCATTSNAKHIVKEPLQLSCGHCICRECIKIFDSKLNSRCISCNSLNKNNLSESKECLITKALIKANFKEIIRNLKSSYSKSHNKFQG